MQRKFLEELKLEKEVIDSIMSESDKEIETLNNQVTEVSNQLTTAKDTLKSFEGVDVSELKGKIETLTQDLATKDTEYQANIADMKFTAELDSVINKFNPKNSKLVKALLDMDNLKSSKNQAEDIKSAIESLTKAEDSKFLFESKVLKGAKPAESGGDIANTNLDYSKMTYDEIAAAMESN